MRTVGIFLVLLVLATSGCAQPVDVEAEAAAIRRAEGEWSKAAEAKDIEGFLSFWTDDASVLPPNRPIGIGKDAIQAAVSEFWADPNFAESWQPTKVEVGRAGDLAYSVGTWDFTISDAEGKPVSGRGKYVTIWKKQRDGSWKAVLVIFNSDQPAAAVEE